MNFYSVVVGSDCVDSNWHASWLMALIAQGEAGSSPNMRLCSPAKHAMLASEDLAIAYAEAAMVVFAKRGQPLTFDVLCSMAQPSGFEGFCEMEDQIERDSDLVRATLGRLGCRKAQAQAEIRRG